MYYLPLSINLAYSAPALDMTLRELYRFCCTQPNDQPFVGPISAKRNWNHNKISLIRDKQKKKGNFQMKIYFVWCRYLFNIPSSFNVFKSCCRQSIDEFHFNFSRYIFRFVLESVSRPYFDNTNFCWILVCTTLGRITLKKKKYIFQFLY